MKKNPKLDEAIELVNTGLRIVDVAKRLKLKPQAISNRISNMKRVNGHAQKTPVEEVYTIHVNAGSMLFLASRFLGACNNDKEMASKIINSL